jgi:hypothetical protein
MKKLMYLLSVVGVVLCMSLTVNARFVGSVVQTGGTVTSATVVTSSGSSVALKVISSGLASETDPAIQLSSVADVLNGTSGLPESADLLVQTVYEAISSTNSTEEFLDLLSDSAKEAFEKAVGEVNVENYEALSMFDISLNDAAKELLAEGGSVDIDLEVAGVTTTNNPIAFHCTGDPATTSDSEVVNGEVLPSRVERDGVLTVTMTSFSPVIVFVESSDSTTTGNNGNNTSNSGNGSNTSNGSTSSTTGSSNVTTSVANGGNTYLMAGTVALVAAAGIGVYSLARKKRED